jgi:hypothetical protein
MGPKTVRIAAKWADGLAGTTLDLDVGKVSALYGVARRSWADTGRRPPRLTTSFWFALGPQASPREQMCIHLRH